MAEYVTTIHGAQRRNAKDSDSQEEDNEEDSNEEDDEPDRKRKRRSGLDFEGSLPKFALVQGSDSDDENDLDNISDDGDGGGKNKIEAENLDGYEEL